MTRANTLRIQLFVWRLTTPFMVAGFIIAVLFSHRFVGLVLLSWLSMLNLVVCNRLFRNSDKFRSFISSFKRRKNRLDRYCCLAVYLFLTAAGGWLTPYSPTLGFCKPITDRDLSDTYLAAVPNCTLENRLLLTVPFRKAKRDEWLPLCIGNGHEFEVSKIIFPTTHEELKVWLAKGVLKKAQRITYQGRVLYYFTGQFDWQYRGARISGYLFGLGWGGVILVPPLRVLPLQFALYFICFVPFVLFLWWSFTVVPKAQLYWHEEIQPKLPALFMLTTLHPYAEEQLIYQGRRFAAKKPFSISRAKQVYWLDSFIWLKEVALTKFLSLLPESLQDKMRHIFFG